MPAPRTIAPRSSHAAAAVRGAVAGWGITRAHGPICARVFAALTDTEGAVTWTRRELLRRVAEELGDLKRTRAQLRQAEADMVVVLPQAEFPADGGEEFVGVARICLISGAARVTVSASPHQRTSW